MAKTKKNPEVYIKEIVDFINDMPEEDQVEFISDVVANTLASGVLSPIERLGILECTRIQLIDNVINLDVDEEIDKLTKSN